MRGEGGGERVGEGGLAEVAFLVKFWREDGVEKVVDGVGVSHQIIRYRDWLYKVLGRAGVSIQAFRERLVFDSARQKARFLLSLYERKDCFMFLPFSLERKRKKRGEPTMVPPRPPFNVRQGKAKIEKHGRKYPGQKV